MSKKDVDKLWLKAYKMNIMRMGARPIFRKEKPIRILGTVTVFWLVEGKCLILGILRRFVSFFAFRQESGAAGIPYINRTLSGLALDHRVAFPHCRVKSLIETRSPMLYLAAPSVAKAELQPQHPLLNLLY
jgi:hypothetical protein